MKFSINWKLFFLNFGIFLILILALNRSFALDIYSDRLGISVTSLGAVEAADHSIKGASRYSSSGQAIDSSLPRRLAERGVNLVRLVVNPIPLFQRSSEHRALALNTVLKYVGLYRDAGISVIVDMHFWSPDPVGYMRDMLTDDVQRAAFRKAVVDLSTALSELPKRSVALEVLNEPPVCSMNEVIDWRKIQIDLLRAIRVASKDLPIVVTGCGGDINGLLQLTDREYFVDKNLIYTFHFYEPYIFTHQDAIFGLSEYPISYPPDFDINSTNLEAREGGFKKKSYTVGQMKNYLDLRQNPTWMADRFELVARWADMHSLPRGKIFLGEFGAVIGVTPTSERPRGSQLRWIKDVTTLAQKNGFSYAYWVYPSKGKFDYDARQEFLRDDVSDAIGLKKR